MGSTQRGLEARMRGIFLRGMALAAVLALFMVGTAFAEGFVASTSLSLSVSPGKTIEQGTQVTFSGRLHSDRAFCRNHSKVTLRRYGEFAGENDTGGKVASTKTTNGGHFEFTVRIDEQARYRVWFKGKVGGVHPNLKTCEKSRSKTIAIDFA